MWTRSYSATVADLKIEQLWVVRTDVAQWHTWKDDVEYAHLNGTFDNGQTFTFKPRGGPRLQLDLLDVIENQCYSDLTRFLGAKMWGIHEFTQSDNGVEIKTTIKLKGRLAWLWRKLVVQKIVDGLPHQTAKLVERARYLECQG